MSLRKCTYKHKLVDGELIVVRGLHLKDVCRCVATYYGIPSEELTRPSSRANIKLTRARQVAAALSYWLTSNSSLQVSYFYGYGDRTTVVYASKQAAERLRRDNKFRADIASLRARLTAGRLPQSSMAMMDCGASARVTPGSEAA